MAIYSCNLRSIGRTTHRPGTAGAHIRYISRSGADPFILARHIPKGGRAARAWLNRRERALRKNARVIDKLRLALPRELSARQRAQLVSDFMTELTGDRIPWFGAIHQTGKDALNPHVHIAIHDRDIDTGKRVLRLSDNARDREKARLPGPKAVDWLRERWEIAGNRALEQAGQTVRIDRRTLKEQGIDREPTIHEGPRAAKINDFVQRPQSRKRVNGCGRVIDYPSIDNGRTRREFNAHIIDLNLARAAAKSKDPVAFIWSQFERDEAAKDNALAGRLAIEQRKRTAALRLTSLLYRTRIKRLIAERNLRLRAAIRRIRKRFALKREDLRARQQRERGALKAKQRRFSAKVLRLLDFTGRTRRRQYRARKALVEEHRKQRSDLSRRYTEAQRLATAYTKAFHKADIDEQRMKREQHLAQLRAQHAQAETFAQYDLQQREIEREHLRRIIQRKIDAWQADQNRKKRRDASDGDGGKSGGGISAAFAQAILSAARDEADRPDYTCPPPAEPRRNGLRPPGSA